MTVQVLVIGSGGREHAIACSLAKSDQVDTVYISPGNAGTVKSGKISNVDVGIKDHGVLAQWCKDHGINLVVVGPEDPLAAGIADDLNKLGVPCFGPGAKAAQIEASKDFAKDFMTRHDIPTARWKSFTDSKEACNYINSADFLALVVKASGLAAGKGVIVASCKEEACKAAIDMLEGNKFGNAGSVVVIEELLQGEEVSCLAFSDGTSIVAMPPAQDHKRLLEGDEGLNTGGMGAYCPCPLVSNSDFEFIKEEILQKAVNGMKAEGMPYVGVLYAGLMLTSDGPKTLEFNCRFGDPETQVLLPLLKSDLYSIMQSCVQGKLSKQQVQFDTNKYCVAVVAVSGGYPGSYKKGCPISGIDKVEKLNMKVIHAGTKLSDDKVLTSGGRVLAVVSTTSNLEGSALQAQAGAAMIQFEGKFFRKDIAYKALKEVKLSYSDSGVDIEAGDALVDSIKPFAKATARKGCSAELGGFGGIFDIKAEGFKDPLLVSGTDGVGTKLKVAQACGMHSTIGQDLVAMCVNDVLCHGAEPLYFLDYFGCGKLDVGTAKSVIEGIAHGCQLSGCALLGGETAEMPGMYQPGDYDLAGFTVGAVERELYLPSTDDIKQGDVLIGVASSGLHSNGFSLVRRVVEFCGYTYDMTSPFDNTKKLGESLLVPTNIYSKTMLPVLRSGKVKALCHITGGGLPGNVVRVLPEGLGAKLDASKWNVHAVFGWLAAKGNVDAAEMSRTFNCGLGMVLVVAGEHKDEVVSLVQTSGEQPSAVGVVCTHTGTKRVEITNLEESLRSAYETRHGKHKSSSDLVIPTQDKKAKINGHPQGQDKKKVAVLISGSGTNLQALIDHTTNPANHSAAQITLVVSNKPDVKGLKRAEAAGIATQVISHKNYKSRADFDAALHEKLEEAEIDLVCLAGFMRILTGGFVNKWTGRMLNVHPALLPSFKGANAQKQAIEAKVKMSGCSVHFVAEEVDGGAILVQEAVPVYPTDTEDTLSERIRSKEHLAFPEALELVASGKAKLGDDGVVAWS